MMLDLDKPTCWKCGSPVFNHWLRGYVCPYCTQVKQLKAMERMAKQQASQFRIEQNQVHDPVYVAAPVQPTPVYIETETVESTDPVETKTSFGEGVIVGIVTIAVLYGIFTGIAWTAVNTWSYVIHPVLHIVTLGLI